MYLRTHANTYILTNWFLTAETYSGISEDPNTLHKVNYYIHYIALFGTPSEGDCYNH